MLIWDFFQNQILGMKWLSYLVSLMLTSLGVDLSTRIGASIQFFIYDTIKILILLSILIGIISYIQSYFPPERTKKILRGFHGVIANILSALLGTVTPFCSCSSIPIFIGFTRAGLPIGVIFSFLISSPLVDLGSLILLMSIFGVKIAIIYVIIGLVLAVIGGTILGKLNFEKYIEDYIVKMKSKETEETEGLEELEVPKLTKRERLTYGKEQVVAIVKKVFWYIIIGVGIGAIIHNWIPNEWVQNILGANNPFSVILVTIIGVPMYADIFGTIPIAEALLAKGVGVGTILSFMMSVTALSLPSMIMLRKAVKPKLLWIFIGIVTVGIIMIGYLFNAISFLII